MIDVIRPVIPKYDPDTVQITMAYTPKMAKLKRYNPMKTVNE